MAMPGSKQLTTPNKVHNLWPGKINVLANAPAHAQQRSAAAAALQCDKALPQETPDHSPGFTYQS